VTLYQCVPRQDKFDAVVQKCVEAGVHAIVPVVSARCQVPAGGVPQARAARWRRIAMEAAKQCGRGIVPEVRAPLPFAQAVAEARAAGGSLLIPYERCEGPTLKQALRSLRAGAALPGAPGGGPVFALFVGPEGGFEPGEAALAQEAGAEAVTLGPRVYRTETAGLAAVVSILYEFGD
jgi:16S rRNA (uracil1498-N3)-methyltransferase